MEPENWGEYSCCQRYVFKINHVQKFNKLSKSVLFNWFIVLRSLLSHWWADVFDNNRWLVTCSYGLKRRFCSRCEYFIWKGLYYFIHELLSFCIFLTWFYIDNNNVVFLLLVFLDFNISLPCRLSRLYLHIQIQLSASGSQLGILFIYF